ncbi:hypothetical protein HMPREF1210_02603 [Paenisporosarcina sp. HGH0030]|uniref:DUF4097 family beta strand repeat-containing protein n=1 Tax=Paenisporosarcina sp. HGH0030 TaxID=1078085 RepID=UPI00034E74E7|nr:DUF4097 family beta strand repeat-containing protein [Paenisporosarcina sp. HGH0030]EPD50633.1 hypothetical protein HMPREF1210_02603 [Paenisporosarcina sp. HGH0030]
MQEERKRILDLVEKGTISAQEALVLLEALGNDKAKPSVSAYAGPGTSDVHNHSTHTNSETHNKKTTSSQAEDFMEDIKRDFSQFSDRFMQFMQTAVGKMKSFDFDMPFGEPNEFHHTFTKELADFKEVSVDIANGKFEIYPSQDGQVRAECHVKVYRAPNEEDGKKDFFEKFVFVVDQQRLRIISDMKTTSVNVVLYVPKQMYDSISVRLFNGAFISKHLEVGRFKVKTANGKIELKNVQLEDGEIQTANGAINIKDAIGNKVDAETINGRIYIDGHLKDIEAQSVNGHVVVTTKNPEARKVEGRAVAGTVEIYVPSTVALQGEVASNFGKMDVSLPDVTRLNEQEHFLQKNIRFTKELTDSTAAPLYIKGEAKTGSIVVRYTTAE